MDKQKKETKEKEDVQSQTKKTKTVEEERDEYLAGWKRALADYENLKKDLMKERDFIRAAVTEAVSSAYLPIYDHLMAATYNTPNIPEAQKWFEGVSHIAQQCKDTLAEFGVEKMNINVGDAFNPDKHEAVQNGYQEGLGEEEIISELQSGFEIKGKVIRPAKVVVSIGKETAEKNAIENVSRINDYLEPLGCAKLDIVFLSDDSKPRDTKLVGVNNWKQWFSIEYKGGQLATKDQDFHIMLDKDILWTHAHYFLGQICQIESWDADVKSGQLIKEWEKKEE